RGGIVDERALAAAIRAARVAGAALDVFEREPPPADHPLVGLEQVIVTPHLGAATDEAQTAVALAIAEQVADALRHGVVVNAVNLPSMDAETYREAAPWRGHGVLQARGALRADRRPAGRGAAAGLDTRVRQPRRPRCHRPHRDALRPAEHQHRRDAARPGAAGRSRGLHPEPR